MLSTTWFVLCLTSFTLGNILTNKIDRSARSRRSSSSSSSRGSISGGRVHPIVLVPGNGGSQLEAQLNKTMSSHWWCSKTSDWWAEQISWFCSYISCPRYTLWLNLEQLGPWQISCFAENIRFSISKIFGRRPFYPGWSMNPLLTPPPTPLELRQGSKVLATLQLWSSSLAGSGASPSTSLPLWMPSCHRATQEGKASMGLPTTSGKQRMSTVNRAAWSLTFIFWYCRCIFQSSPKPGGKKFHVEWEYFSDPYLPQVGGG